ncbi:hypothetical protein EI555_011310 [Monodon monoceros]|uniref:Protocadherin Fat 4 n=1 Tax=Monodon monoceros TaxID=40151 RepID=A0A4U1FFA6_MONMO|nr:hypothetical protein EI555_011310 [Monodon monoceros]
MYFTTIPEDDPTGTDVLLVNASDADASTNAVISYRIIGGNSQFTINPSTGQIITSALLDRETKENYTLVVVACDAGSPEPLSSSTSVLVTVTDVNDNPPRFQHHPYVTHIPSPTLPGSFVFAVTVTDADFGPNAELHYSLSGRNSEKFHIDPLRGAIMAARPLNGTSEVTFSVHVKDGGSFPKTDSTTVTVRFVNKADFPKVRAKEQTFVFPEDQPVGTLVTTITGSSLRGEPLSYYIASGNLGNTFQTDQLSGQVSISQPLDFEKIQKYVVWIEARDGGFPPFSSYEKLDITVLDVNDNSPVFKEDPFVSEILENLSPRKILTVSAVDKDSGPNGQLDYEIVNGNREHSFSINHATGEVRSVRPLDREKISQHVLTIKSSDKGSPSQSTSVKVIINILDENDNAPRFSQIFSAHVPENSPLGYTVTRVTTSDEDIGVNAVSRYSIMDTSLPFTINPSTGDIVISRPLNREDTDRYRIRVSAHDSGWTVSTDVTIFVTDVNDNAPRFSRPSYYLDFPELTETGSRVTQVSATDPDEGSNGQVFYFIKSQSEYFRINATTGEIFNKQVLIYQNVSGFSNVNINRHSFIVTSSDRGNPALLSETTVTINTVDSNDNAPQFLKTAYFTPVTKHVKIGTKLIKVTAVDEKDFGLNSEVEYFISNENHLGKFKLDNNTGWISVAAPLISDLNQNFLITVTAKDKGNPPLSSQATVQIIVTEENYHTPEFSQSHMSATIPESHSIGAIVRTVSARDRDTAMNGLIKYSISSGNEEGIFAINSSTGVLTLAKALDYELCQKHEMTISATDGGWIARTGYCSVTVDVIDVNDNSPVFLPDEYFPTVLENAPSGTTVIHLNATDADSGTNAVTAYTIQSSDSDLFVIDPNTGVITTQGFLDFETKQSYHLTVKAFNVPDEERCSFATVNIQLKGTNEYVPRFVSKLYYFEISEAAPKCTIVGEVFASDRDLGTDGEVHYLIFGNSRKKGFQINKKTGQIYVSGLLDREKEERVSLKVLAKNFGSIRGADIDEVTVNVTVLDANDPPVFSLNIYSVQISEGVPTGTHVTFVSAFDSDSVPSWSRFSYFIGSGNENGAFSINPQTGQITVTAELDRETLPIYNLTVLAVDSGTPSATGSASLLVTLEDINDNGPMLTISEGEVMENKRPGTLVMALQSTDPDLPPNQGPFTYYLLSTGPATSYFSLNTAGVLSTTREIDREQIADFYLSVVTRDSGVPQMSSTGTVHITVIDQNDNPSQSRTVEIFVNYYGNLFPGGILGSVKPQDPDVLDTFHCSLTSGVTSLFSIPRGTCNLSSQPRSTDGTFDLTVLSNDGVHSTVTSNIRVFFTGFSNTTVDNSILLRLSVPSVKDFLTNHYLHFLRIASSQLTGLGTAVQLYGAYEGNNRTFLLAAVKRNHNQYVNPSGVATFFESIKEILFRQSGVKVESVDHDSCAPGPCQNGGSCVRRLAVSFELKSHESLPVIIVANEPLQPFLCKCLPGYTGSWCEIDIDECLPSPCHNGGTCHNLVGGFSCSCPDGFTGRACERDINECLPSPCKNSAICQNFPGGFNCVCKTGYTDREKISQHVLTIKSSDKGSPSQSTSVKVIINILDENDNAPRFSQIFSAHVPENSPLGYTVTRVTTSDEDIGVNAVSRYSIMDTSLPFTINPSTGDIVISRPLNREDTDRYRIRVSAHDSGWTVSTDVTIFVTDVNDNAPRFSRPSYYLDFPELTETGSRVTQVSATDPDEGSNGQVFYFIKSQSEYFRINATTGEIFNKQVLIYQNVSGFSNVNINRHSFIVTSSDRGNPALLSETTVTINTVDSNDNAPQFLKTAYFTPVTKHVKIGTKLIKVTAVDEKDFGLNSEVEYFISNENHLGKFKLDNNTGWISVAAPLISDLNQNFLITVTAKDKGNPPLSSQATVQIIVTEENYHTPEFSQSHMSATIPESHSIGAIVRTVSARDRDTAMNGLIKYSISSGNEEGIFAINSSTGVLTLAKALDYELCQKHEMTISATDGGWVARTGYCSVTVDVIDFIPEVKFLSCTRAKRASYLQKSVLKLKAMGKSVNLQSITVNATPALMVVPVKVVWSHTTAIVRLVSVFGKHCELNSYGFEELSYMEFPSLDPNNNYIYVKFATIKSHALLLYNYDNQTGDRAEFLALEIAEERLRFSYNLGSGTYKLTTMKKVSDGHFHTVIARRAGMAASLTVDSCSENQEPGYCTVSNVAVSDDWTLDIQPNRVTVGGIRSLEPILQRRGHVESHDFVGCIMEFAVNGRPLEPSQALAAQGILDQCPRLEAITPDTALSLEGKGRLDYHMSQNEKREYLLRQSIRGAMLEPFGVNSLEVKFRTRSENGILIHIQESSNYTTVKIKNGKVHFTSDAGIAGKVERNIPEVYVADGHWHTFLIGKNGTATVLSIDRIYNRDIIHPTQDFGGLDVLTISLGGIPPNQAHRDTQTGFDGCIASVLYGGESLPFSGKHSLASISKTDPSVKMGCRGPNICASNPCWGDLLCVNQWHAYKCVPPGDCASHPCQNGGSCEPGLHSGFTCSCPESHTGRTCETVVACLGVFCPPGRVCKAGSPGGHVCVVSQGPEEISLPLWAVPAIVGSCATVLALLVLSLILCNQCRGKKAKNPKEEKKPKEKKKKGSENVAFDDPDNIPPYGEDMTVRKQPEGNPKPDIIERENPYLIYDETDLPHNSETIPSAPLASPEQEIEHYDIDNASSIAPSDADIIQHYKQFRSHTPKFSIQRHSPLGFARQSPMPLGASSLTYQTSYSQGLRSSSLSHSACPTPNPLSRHSPAPFSKSSTFYRSSPARELHLPIRDGNTLEMHGDVCQPGIFNYAARLGRRSKSPQAMASHGSRPGSRLKQPIGQIPLESSPPVGLSIEEVERLNTPRPRNPSICSADHGRSSSEEDCRRPLSRTRNPADGIPAPESSSDSDSHESFTCSEMEYDREKPMVYTSRMPKLSQVNESDADDEDNYGARLKPRRYHGRRAEGGPVGTQAAVPGVADNTLPLKLGQQAGNFNWDNLLNWGPGFGHYVDVFKDLASLPEKAAANEEGKGGTTKPAPKDGEAEQYV